MRAVIQKVSHAHIAAADAPDAPFSQIPHGLCVLLGVGGEDSEADARYIADKTAVARPAFLSADERRVVAAQAAARLGEPFRLVPREKNPSYCTTLIHDALTTLRPDLHARWRHIDLPLLGGDYLFPQALGELPGIQWLTAP